MARSNLLIVFVAAALVACGTTSGTRTVEHRPDDPPPSAEVYRHPSSGMEFPASLETLERDAIKTYDEQGDNVSVGYHRVDDDVTLAVTVYIYPRKDSLESEFAGAKAAIEQHRQGAKLIVEGPMGMEQAGSMHQGHRAHYLIRAPDEPPQLSHLFLFDHGPWRVKYRVTFLAHQHELADPLVVRFMKALPWPALSSGPLALAEEAKPTLRPLYRPTNQSAL